jgi:multidrug resistance protein MdtO
VAAQAQAALGAIESDLRVIHYEPTTIRPDPGWIETRRAVVREIDALAAPLLLLADKDRGGAARASQSLERIAERLSASAASGVSPAAQEGVASEGIHKPQYASPWLRLLRREVREHLHRLDTCVDRESLHEASASHATA